ncbi:retron St85 family effector protein [Teichococcus deserti]|uniref:retron St85 family effector protein n=1 Tax=Teichococcus deserti TaxID=1817963 RepID=UPI001A962FB5|nr:retron St85 family effector protein [Pseudoroseomonas deserti]
MLLLKEAIPEIVECIDPDSLRVYAPKPVIFVCGGRYDLSCPSYPHSLRDAFFRINLGSDKKILLAEELQDAFFPAGHYKDILQLESDIAQISDYVILFSESYGSAAELGAFATEEEIARRILVFMDDYHYSQKSFIVLGPIRSLERRFRTSVCVLNRAELGIFKIDHLETLKMDIFTARIKSAMDIRLTDSTSREHTTFNSSRTGHVIKLMTGLIQHYGALTADEIEAFLYILGIKKKNEEIENLLLCAEYASWIKSEKRGVNKFFVSIANEKNSIGYKLLKEAKIDREKWKFDVRSYWKKHDPERFACISSAVGTPR